MYCAVLSCDIFAHLRYNIVSQWRDRNLYHRPLCRYCNPVSCMHNTYFLICISFIYNIIRHVTLLLPNT